MQSVWMINRGTDIIEVCDMDLKKWLYFHPGKPVCIPYDQALKYVGQYRELKTCDNPEKYFIGSKMRQLIIRDAGIGDLLLLEPLLRKMSRTRDISVVTRYPETYHYNPAIMKLFRMESKNETVKNSDYDGYEDLRSWSETANSRDSQHRTDVYNEKLHIELTDAEKEPQVWFGKDERAKWRRNEKQVVFVLQCDASHSYRRYEQGEKLAKYIVDMDNRNVVILIGSSKYVKMEKRHERIIDLQGKTTIREAMCQVRDADYFIGVDSGFMHVAMSCHVPTVAMFSIITPDLRLRYYRGPYKVIHGNVPCIGCGNRHMVVCNYGDRDKDSLFRAPCLDIPFQKIYGAALSLPKCEKVVMISDYSPGVEQPKVEVKPVAVVHGKAKLTMPIIFQNEAKNIPRFIELVMKHPAIGRVIAIDGGSTDGGEEMLLKAGAEVYLHPYLKHYHEMQAMQRNISCSYVADGTNILIMDLDECFSKELSEYLYFLAEQNEIIYGLISRKTFEYYKDIEDPAKAIKQYPDWQPRFYRWDRRFKFVGGAHHNTVNVPAPVKIQKDIIHFEREGKDREAMETQWKTMMEGVKKYGH